MPDNVEIGNYTYAADELEGGVQIQRMKMTHGVDGTALDVSPLAPMPVATSPATSSSISVSGYDSENYWVTVVAANPSRKGLMIYNNSEIPVMILFSAEPVEAFTFKLFPDALYEMGAAIYSGNVLLHADEGGNVIATELT